MKSLFKKLSPQDEVYPRKVSVLLPNYLVTMNNGRTVSKLCRVLITRLNSVIKQTSVFSFAITLLALK